MPRNKRPKAQTEAQCSDILEESEGNTFVWDACHGKTEMCTRVPRNGRVFFLLTFAVIAVLVDAAGGCDVDGCWHDYRSASKNFAEQNRLKPEMTEHEVLCVGLRTYFKCLEELHGCKGNIMYHSAKKFVRNRMNEKQCSSAGPVYTIDEIGEPVLPPDELCTYRGAKEYKHCVLFGDPHIQTFNSDFQTCRVKGAWPLIANEHLTVQATNENVSYSEGATATTKLTVLIKRNIECASDRYIMYQANSELLPSTFDDGQTRYGKSHSVKLEEVDPGKHIEITLKYIDTRIVVRLVGSSLTFAISMPAEFLNLTSDSNVLELCTKGCPKNEVIDYKRYLAYKQREVNGKGVNITRDEALEMCRRADLVDFYLDSCVFDLLATGNDTFRFSAYAALQDVRKLDPNFSKTQENRTSLDVYDKMYSGGNSAVRTRGYLNLCTVLVLVSVTMKIIENVLSFS